MSEEFSWGQPNVDPQYFSPREFKCPCCGVSWVDPDFIRRLDEVRADVGMPFKVTSGARCCVHNKNVGGAKDSLHLTAQNRAESIALCCRAADILVPSSEFRIRVISCAIEHGFDRFGIGNGYLHIDTGSLVQPYEEESGDDPGLKPGVTQPQLHLAPRSFKKFQLRPAMWTYYSKRKSDVREL